jgi:amino acid transporter
VGFDDIASLAVIAGVFTLSITCIVAVIYVRRVNKERREPSRYLDMLITRDTRIGLAQGLLALFVAYVLCRLWFPESVPSIGPGWSSLWLGSVLLIQGWGPISDARQFKRDRQLGRLGEGE